MVDASWPGWTLAQSVISAAAGLGGVFAGALMTSRNQQRERKMGHIRAQLQEFYSPMLGMRQALAAKEDSRSKINDMVKEVIQKARLKDERPQYTNEEIKTLTGLRHHDHKQWHEEMLPLYKQMLALFTEKMWLAEASTRAHYGELNNFVERWNRFTSLMESPDVSWEADFSDENVRPLYEDLEFHFTRLQMLL